MAKASNVETTNTAWNSTAPLGEFRPYVPESANVPEFTFKAVLFGAIFGIIFGAVTVYVGLRAGLTVSASIPIAVLSISLLRAFGKATILENNIVQTAGSAGESVAAGAIFTLPALIFMGFPVRVLAHLHAGADRRLDRRAVHDPAAAAADRPGARQPALSRRHRLRGRAGRR